MAKAESAAAIDEDDVAKEALRRHHLDRDEVETCRALLDEAEKALETLAKDEDTLRTKLDEARGEQRRLAAALRRAQAEKRAGTVLTGADRPSREADRLRDEIADTQAESEAAREVHGQSIEAQFRELDRGPSLDDELEALKERVKGAPGTGATQG
jgi:phage shock protein A